MNASDCGAAGCRVSSRSDMSDSWGAEPGCTSTPPSRSGRETRETKPVAVRGLEPQASVNGQKSGRVEIALNAAKSMRVSKGRGDVTSSSISLATARSAEVKPRLFTRDTRPLASPEENSLSLSRAWLASSWIPTPAPVRVGGRTRPCIASPATSPNWPQRTNYGTSTSKDECRRNTDGLVEAVQDRRRRTPAGGDKSQMAVVHTPCQG